MRNNAGNCSPQNDKFKKTNIHTRLFPRIFPVSVNSSANYFWINKKAKLLLKWNLKIKDYSPECFCNVARTDTTDTRWWWWSVDVTTVRSKHRYMTINNVQSPPTLQLRTMPAKYSFEHNNDCLAYSWNWNPPETLQVLFWHLWLPPLPTNLSPINWLKSVSNLARKIICCNNNFKFFFCRTEFLIISFCEFALHTQFLSLTVPKYIHFRLRTKSPYSPSYLIFISVFRFYRKLHESRDYQHEI